VLRIIIVFFLLLFQLSFSAQAAEKYPYDLFREGFLSKAADSYAAEGKKTNTARPYMNAAMCLRQAGKYKEAISLLEKAAEIDNSNAELLSELGWLKFPHDDDSRRTNVPQFFLGLISLAFAVYMVPGLWGAPLKAVSAFAPPMYTQDFNLYDNSVEAKYTDYELGMAAAQREGKPVMVDFTGYGCVNCRKMEAAVWTDDKVRDILNDDYVLISLYVDDKTPLPEAITVTEANGQTRKLRTVGDKWSYLQRTKIGANTQPYYVLLDPKTGRPLNGLRSYDEDVDAYVKFLQDGLKNFRK